MYISRSIRSLLSPVPAALALCLFCLSPGIATAEDLSSYGEMYKTFETKSAELERRYNAELEKIRSTGGGADKQKQIFDATERYKAQSRELVKTYREPVVNKIIEEANKGRSDDAGIQRTLGTSVDSDKHRGRDGDVDAGGSAGAVDKAMRVAEQMGLNKGQSSSLFSGEAGSSSIGGGVNLTIHKQGDFGNVGSSAHQTRIGGDAASHETYVSAGMQQGQPGKTYVEVQDHIKKASDGLSSSPGDLLKSPDKLQGLAKGTTKAIESSGLSDGEIQKIMKQNNVSGTPDQFRQQLQGLKEGHARAPEGVGVDSSNIDSIQKASRDILNAASQKSQQQAQQEMSDAAQKIKTLETSKNPADKAEAQKLRTQVVDSRVRIKETTKVSESLITRQPAPSTGPPDSEKGRTETPAAGTAKTGRQDAAGTENGPAAGKEKGSSPRVVGAGSSRDTETGLTGSTQTDTSHVKTQASGADGTQTTQTKSTEKTTTSGITGSSSTETTKSTASRGDKSVSTETTKTSSSGMTGSSESESVTKTKTSGGKESSATRTTSASSGLTGSTTTDTESQRDTTTTPKGQKTTVETSSEKTKSTTMGVTTGTSETETTTRTHESNRGGSKETTAVTTQNKKETDWKGGASETQTKTTSTTDSEGNTWSDTTESKTETGVGGIKTSTSSSSSSTPTTDGGSVTTTKSSYETTTAGGTRINRGGEIGAEYESGKPKTDGGGDEDGKKPAAPGQSVTLHKGEFFKPEDKAEITKTKSGSFGTTGGTEGSYEATVQVDQEKKSAGFEVKTDGRSVNVDATAEYERNLIKATGNVKGGRQISENVRVDTSAQGEVQVGMQGKATSQNKLGPDGLTSHNEVEVFAGGKAKGQVEGSTTIFGITFKGKGEAEAWAGAGGKGTLDMQIGWGKFKLGGKLGGAIGLGGALGGGIEIDASEALGFPKENQEHLAQPTVIAIMRATKNGDLVAPEGMSRYDLMTKARAEAERYLANPEKDENGNNIPPIISAIRNLGLQPGKTDQDGDGRDDGDGKGSQPGKGDGDSGRSKDKNQAAGDRSGDKDSDDGSGDGDKDQPAQSGSADKDKTGGRSGGKADRDSGSSGKDDSNDSLEGSEAGFDGDDDAGGGKDGDKDGGTGLDSFVKGNQSRSTGKDDYDINTANADVNTATTSSDQAARDADRTRDQGGQDSQTSRDQGAAEIAKNDRDNSWGTAVGDAVESGLIQGGQQFGSAVGSHAAGAASDAIFGNPNKGKNNTSGGGKAGDDGDDGGGSSGSSGGGRKPNSGGGQSSGGQPGDGSSGGQAGDGSASGDGSAGDGTTGGAADGTTAGDDGSGIPGDATAVTVSADGTAGGAGNTVGAPVTDSGSGGQSLVPVSKQISGGAALAGKQIVGASASITYDAYGIPDHFKVTYSGATLGDSGMRSGSGTLSGKAAGSDSYVTVTVICPNDNTSWTWSGSVTFYVK